MLLYHLSLECGVALEDAGSDLGFLGFAIWIAGRWRLPIGGMQSYSDALYGAAVAAGAKVRFGTAAQRVVIEKGRATAVETIDGPLEAAIAPQSVTIRLEDNVDVARGDMLADPERPPTVARELTAHLCWMSEKPLLPGSMLAVKHTTRASRARVEELVSVVDMDTLEDRPAPAQLELNDLAVVKIRLSEPLVVDLYERDRATGAFILIDEASNDTVAAGMILDASS